MMRAVVLMIVLGFATTAFAEPAAKSSASEDSHPALSSNGSWAGEMVIIVIGLFLAAMVIGPIVRANMPPAPPDVPLHDMHADADDAHGQPHEHGHGGGHGH